MDSVKAPTTTTTTTAAVAAAKLPRGSEEGEKNALSRRGRRRMIDAQRKWTCELASDRAAFHYTPVENEIQLVRCVCLILFYFLSLLPFCSSALLVLVAATCASKESPSSTRLGSTRMQSTRARQSDYVSGTHFGCVERIKLNCFSTSDASK